MLTMGLFFDKKSQTNPFEGLRAQYRTEISLLLQFFQMSR